MAKGRYSIDDALEAVGFGRFQWTLLVLSGIGFFATTVELIAVSLLRAPLRQQWPAVDDKRFAYLMSATFAGELLGGLAWGAVSDRMGRRATFAGTALMAAVFGMLGSIVPCFYTFAITRFGLGFAIGGSLAIDFVYFVEFVPATSRGFRTTFIILLGIMAFFYTSLIGWLTLPVWRHFVFFCGLPYGLLFLGRLAWRWESPRFLMARGRTAEATEVLRQIAKQNGTVLPEGELEPLQNISTAAPGLASIASAGMILPTITVSILFFFQTFSYYGLTIWLRSFAVQRGIPNFNPMTAFLVIGLSELPGLALTTLLIERAGRRPVLLINFVGSALCSAMLLLVTTQTGFLAVTCASYFFIVGCWAAIYVSTPEVFPTTCRASAFAVAGAFGKLAGMTSPHLFGHLFDIKAPFGVIVACVSGGFLIAALTSALLMVETTGRRLRDN